MIVLEKELSKPYEMIDMVTTPDGSLVAMVHCNNCTSDLNAWVNLFKEYQELLGIPVNMDEIYSKLYNIALTGDTDCGGLLSYNYISGEPVTGLAEAATGASELAGGTASLKTDYATLHAGIEIGRAHV